MKIVFMGTPSIAKMMLEALLMHHEVIKVVTQPDKRVGRKKEIVYSSVKQCAIENGIEVLQPNKISEIYEELKALDCDLIVTCAYGQKIPMDILNLPKFGSINVHASLLPKLRGGAPIHYAIMQGHEYSGVSIMRMSEELDAGDYMSQVKVKIEDDDTMGSLYDKLANAGALVLLDSVQKIAENKAVFIAQDESEVSYAPTIKKEDEKISFKQDVKKAYNHARALIPTPCGYGVIDGKKIKIHALTYEYCNHEHELGKVIGLENKMIKVACDQGYLYLKEVQMEGKKKMDAHSFYMGSGKSLVNKCFE